MDHHAQRHAQPRQDHRVVAVRGPARLVRVVAQLGALLVPVERLDGRVQVQRVVVRQQRRRAPEQGVPRPRESRRRVLRRPQDEAPHRVAGAHAAHAEGRCSHLVAAQLPEVPIARQPQHDPRHGRRKDFLDLRRVRARVAHRAGLRKPLERSARMQERGKVRQERMPRDRRLSSHLRTRTPPGVSRRASSPSARFFRLTLSVFLVVFCIASRLFPSA